MVKEEMHLQESTLFHLWPWCSVKDKHETLSGILYIIWPMHLQSLKLLCPTVKGDMHLQKIFDLVSRSHEALPSTPCDLCTCKVWSCYGQLFTEMHLHEIHYLTLVTRSMPRILDFTWPFALQSLMLLHPMVKEKMHLQENTLFYLDFVVKVTQNVAQCPLHHVTYAPTEFEVTTSYGLGDAFTRKFIIWPLTLGSRSHKLLPSTLCIMWPIQLQNLKLLRPTV